MNLAAVMQHRLKNAVNINLLISRKDIMGPASVHVQNHLGINAKPV